MGQNKKILHRVNQVKHVHRANLKTLGIIALGFGVFALSGYVTVLWGLPWLGLLGAAVALGLMIYAFSRVRYVFSESEALSHIYEALEHLSDFDSMDYESAAKEIRAASRSMRVSTSAMNDEVTDSIVTLRRLLKAKLLLLVDKHDYKKVVPILTELETQLLDPSVVGFEKVSKKLQELPGQTRTGVSSRLSSLFTNRGPQVVFSILAGVAIPLIVGFVYAVAAESDPVLFIRQNLAMEVPGSFGLIAVFLGFFGFRKQ